MRLLTMNIVEFHVILLRCISVWSCRYRRQYVGGTCCLHLHGRENLECQLLILGKHFSSYNRHILPSL